MRRRFLNNIKSISGGNHSEYFTIEALEDGLTAKLSTNACKYRIDDGRWITLYAGSNTSSINKGQTLSFKGNLIPNEFEGIGTFTISKKCNLKGNIMSLLYGDDFEGQNDLSGKSYVFYDLFKNCTTLQNAENLILPAKTLASYCYSRMFYYCTSLITAPELPATTLENSCYAYMFHSCRKLNYIKMLATDISASWCLTYWVSNVASTGTFTKASSMTSLPTGSDGIPNGWNVEDYVESNLITFTIDGSEFQAEEGMTWEEWCDSEYNTDEYFVDQNSICKINTIGAGGYYKIDNVKYTDIIISNYSYKYDKAHGGGSN